MGTLPLLLATSVVRASNKGESHGGLYLIDLEEEKTSKIIDWNKLDINWDGRGLERGMRGIAYYNQAIYTAISDEILVYDFSFNQIDSIKNKYLKHCHEIYIYQDSLYITSTGFDSILQYNLVNQQFTQGYCLRYSKIKRYLNRFNTKYNLDISFLRVMPEMTIFDPADDKGPLPGDSLHINNVYVNNDVIFVSGRWIGKLLKISENKLLFHSNIPYFTHNARPYENGVIANHTSKDKIIIQNGCKHKVEYYNIPHYPVEELLNYDLPDNFARQGFCRGLCCYEDMIIAGASPATVHVYQKGKFDPIRSVNITMDVRNAIHGLEVFNTKG